MWKRGENKEQDLHIKSKNVEIHSALKMIE